MRLPSPLVDPCFRVRPMFPLVGRHLCVSTRVCEQVHPCVCTCVSIHPCLRVFMCRVSLTACEFQLCAAGKQRR